MIELEERLCKSCGKVFKPTWNINQRLCATCGLKNLLEFINMKDLGSPMIKFRAWDEGNKVMHHDFEFITSGKDGKTDGTDWIVFKSDKQPLSGKPHPLENPYFAQQLKIMQFTGQVDDDGKDIYDGDIMSGDEDELVDGMKVGSISYICRVMWDKANAKWVVEDPFSGEVYELLDFIGAQRVVGNIYENPDMIKDLG